LGLIKLSLKVAELANIIWSSHARLSRRRIWSWWHAWSRTALNP